MRVLVTGAGGYLGLHVVEALSRAGHYVRAMIRDPDPLYSLSHPKRLEPLVADLETPGAVEAAVEGMEACVHAALIWDAPGSEFDLRDTVASAKLFEAAGRAKLRRTVYISSTAVHRPFHAIMRPTDPLATADMYGATKGAGELMLRAACATHGMEGIVLRLGPLVGPPAVRGTRLRTPSRLAQMVNAAVSGEVLLVAGREGRQFANPKASADAITRILTHPAPEPVYLAVDRALTTWKMIAEQICALGPTGARVLARSSTTVSPPKFDTAKFDALLGGPSCSNRALTAHIKLLFDLSAAGHHGQS